MYVFPGLWPFIERVAQGRDLHHLGRAREIWHCKQIQDSLGQLPRLDAKSQRELLDHVLKIRASLVVALEGIDAAVLEVSDEFNLVSSQGQEQDETLQVGLSAVGVDRKRKKETSVSSVTPSGPYSDTHHHRRRKPPHAPSRTACNGLRHG